MTQHHGDRYPRLAMSMALVAMAAMLAACAGSDSGGSIKNAAPSSEIVPESGSGPSATADATFETGPPQPDDASTDSTGVGPDSSAPLGGSANRPEGTWTLILRSEVADPPYDSFVAGQPIVRQWNISPQCDDGACPLVVQPGANGFLPDGGAPPTADPQAAAFTLEPQPDGSYAGTNTYEAFACTTADGTSLDGGSQLSYAFTLTFSAASHGEAPLLRGTRTNNSLPNAAGAAAGCIEYHDTESVIGQPLDFWANEDPSHFTFGTYDWGGLVSDADQYYLDHTAPIGNYRHFNSQLRLDPTCGSPCTVHAIGAVPAFGDIAGTFVDQDGVLTSENSWQDTCVKNGTHDVVIAQHGFDDKNTIQLRPAVVVGGEVLALIGHYEQHSTPTAEAAAASNVDCALAFEEYDVYAATTQPYFAGL